MRKIILLFCAVMVFLLLSSVYVLAEDVTVMWDDPAIENPVDGPTWATYIYLSTTSQQYNLDTPVARADPGLNQVMVVNLVPGTKYYLVATHYDDITSEESDLSEEISYTALGEATGGKTIIPLPPIKKPATPTGTSAS